MAVTDKLTHRFGVLIALSSGEYSDYSFNGLYRVLRDMHLPTLAQAYHDSLPELQRYAGGTYKTPTSTGFGSYLIRDGWVEEIIYDEIHMDYFTFAEASMECKDL